MIMSMAEKWAGCWWCGAGGTIRVPSFLPYSDPDIRHLLDAYCASEALRAKLDDASRAPFIAGNGVEVACPRCNGSGIGEPTPCGIPVLDPIGGQPPRLPGDPRFPPPLTPEAVIGALVDEYLESEDLRRAVAERATDIQ